MPHAQVRDTASDVPADYQPPATFNISLQHTDPKLSWDAEDPERKRKLQVGENEGGGADGYGGSRQE